MIKARQKSRSKSVKTMADFLANSQTLHNQQTISHHLPALQLANGSKCSV